MKKTIWWCVALMALACCSCKKREATSIEDSIIGSEQAMIESTSTRHMFSIENNYYNKMKINGDTIYYCSDKGLNKYNINTAEEEHISDGNYLLGDVALGKLYMLQLPPNESDENGIYGFIVQDENDESVDIVKLDWNGSLSVLATEEGRLEDVVGSKLSAFGDITAYLWNGEIKIIK